MKAKIKLWIEEGGRHIIGTGTAKLLSFIDELGSIRAAASRMKMSYRKAWGAIRTLERNLDFKLIERAIGGSRGGGSVLTPEGQLLLQQYTALDRSIMRFSEQKLKEYFPKESSFPESTRKKSPEHTIHTGGRITAMISKQ